MILLFLLVNTCFASTTEKTEILNYVGIELNIDGSVVIPLDVNKNVVHPFIIYGTTYLPVRAISESLGKDVSWDGENSSVYIKDKEAKDEKHSEDDVIVVEKFVGTQEKKLTYRDIKIYVNDNLIEPKDVNGNIVEPFIIEGTTYLPVRAVSSALGKDVSWDDETKTVIVQTAPAVRAGLGEEFGLPIGTDVEGKMVASLKRLGFDKVFDTDTAAVQAQDMQASDIPAADM